MTNKKTISSYKKWTIVLIVIILFLVAGLIWQHQANDQLILTSKLQKEKFRNQAIKETFLKLLSVDEALLTGFEPEVIREQLLELEATDTMALFDKFVIERRIAYLDSWLQGQSQGDSSLGHLRIALQKTAFERDTLIKHMNFVASKRFKQELQLQADLAALEQQVAEKNRLLSRKEKVQVITFNSLTGKKIHYLGEVVDGKANGNGIGIWSNGHLYRGAWRNNLRHGKGEYEWADGDRYTGEFENGHIDGEGIYYWKSGERYEGTFQGNRRNGKGILFDPDGNIKFQGQWKDDKPL